VLKRSTEVLEAETKPTRRMILTFLYLVMYADLDGDEEVELSPELSEAYGQG